MRQMRREKFNGGEKMSESIIVALISGLLTLLGTAFAVFQASKKTDEQIKINQAITDTKIEELTREVREHNNFARRMPVVEEQIKVINHRLQDLEDDNK